MDASTENNEDVKIGFSQIPTLSRYSRSQVSTVMANKNKKNVRVKPFVRLFFDIWGTYFMESQNE